MLVGLLQSDPPHRVRLYKLLDKLNNPLGIPCAAIQHKGHFSSLHLHQLIVVVVASVVQSYQLDEDQSYGEQICFGLIELGLQLQLLQTLQLLGGEQELGESLLLT